MNIPRTLIAASALVSCLAISTGAQAQETGEGDERFSEAERGFVTTMALAATLADHCHWSTEPNETLVNEELIAIGSKPVDFNASEPPPLFKQAIEMAEEMDIMSAYLTEDQACESLNALFGPKGTILAGLVLRR